MITVDLMFVGVLRIVYSDLNLIIPSMILLLQSFGAAIYERKQILNAINNSDGIMKKPFGNIKDLSQGGIYVVVMIVTMIALRENLNLFAFLLLSRRRLLHLLCLGDLFNKYISGILPISTI